MFLEYAASHQCFELDEIETSPLGRQSQKAGVSDTCSTLFCPLRERALNCNRLCHLYYASFGAEASCKLPSSLWFSVSSRHLECTESCKCSKIGKTETCSLGGTPKSRTLDDACSSFFPLWGEARGWVFFQLHHTELASAMKFSTSFDVVGFMLIWGLGAS